MLLTSMVECTLTGQRFCEVDMDGRLLFLWQQTSFWVITEIPKNGSNIDRTLQPGPVHG